MSGIENPILIQQALSEGSSYGVIQKFIQTSDPYPGYDNLPIVWNNETIGYYNLYPINIPANLINFGEGISPVAGGPENYDIVKGYFLTGVLYSIPSGSAGASVSIGVPEIFEATNMQFILARTLFASAEVSGGTVTFTIPSDNPNLPTGDALMVIGM